MSRAARIAESVGLHFDRFAVHVGIGAADPRPDNQESSNRAGLDMTSTSISLLKRLQQTDDSKNWNRLAELYTPLLLRWLRKYDVQDSDADDIVQDVLLAVSKDLKSFDHNGRPGAFRSRLRTILVHRLRCFWRARGRRPQAKGGSDIE